MNRLLISIALLLSALTAFSAIREEEISVINPLDGTTLNGTLSLPAKGKPKAILVLASGSGLQDRDETIGVHKPFREIAEYMAENGYGALRTDDRGYGNPPDTALLARSSQWDEMSDYRCLVASLKERKDLKGVKIGLLGHSLGGSEAIMCFSKSDKARKYVAVGTTPDFIITLAAPMLPGDQLLLSQLKAILEARGLGFQYAATEAQVAPRYQWAKSDMPDSELREKLYEDVVKDIPPAMLTEALKAQIEVEIGVMASLAYREMLRYDPSEDIKNVNVPWLALFGTKDTQVEATVNSEALKAQLPNAKNLTCEVLVGKNHLFQNAKTGVTEEYDILPEDIAPDVLQEMLEWLVNLSKK